MENKITAGTIARTICLVLALVNQCLGMAGIQLIPIEDATINGSVTISDDQTAGISTMSLMAFSNAATEAEGGTAMFDGIVAENLVGEWRVNIPYSAYLG